MKTARFAQVVAKCGRPVVHDQWLKPEKDAALKQAVKANRVMTVHIHTVGTTKDHGETGLAEGGQRVLLIFPKSLRAFEGRRIVGIDYDLLKEEPQAPKRKPKAAAEKKAEAAETSRSKGRASEAVLRLFRAEEEKAPEEKEAPEKEAPHAQERKSTKAKAGKRPSHAGKRASHPARKHPPATHEATPAKHASAAPADVGRLRAQIQKALRQLKTGKAVMAYETLQQALE